jgi:hypothetical protein
MTNFADTLPDLTPQLVAQDAATRVSISPLNQGMLNNLAARLAAAENTIEILVAELNRVNRKLATKRDAITELSLQENGVQLQYRGEID